MNTLDVQPIILKTRAKDRARIRRQRLDNWAHAGLAGGLFTAGLCCGIIAACLDLSGKLVMGALVAWGIASFYYLLRRSA